MREHARNYSPQTVHGMSRAGFVLLLLGLGACGGGELPQPATPAQPSPSGATGTAPPATNPAAAPSDPFAIPAQPRDEAAEDDSAPLALDAWKKARAAKGVPSAPASCAAFANRVASKDADASSLVAAFAEKDPAKRDARFVALSKLPQTGGAAAYAVRADFAPTECADAIVDRYLETIGTTPPEPPHRGRALVGFLARGQALAHGRVAPCDGALREKEKVKAFITGPLKTWLVEQSTAIEVLSSGAAGLSGYARGIAAIEAGIAEMRLVDKMRSAPVPASWDPELKAIYEAALDEALEPRKKRGRDAALVG